MLMMTNSTRKRLPQQLVSFAISVAIVLLSVYAQVEINPPIASLHVPACAILCPRLT